MNRARLLLKGGSYMLAGRGAEQVLGFVRNLVVARLVSPADFGIAATFAATLSAIELASDISWDKFVIQVPGGCSVELQAACHLMMIGRGVFLAVILFASAPLVARLFNVQDAAWAFQCLALVPVIKGFAHLDVKRFQRALNFRPDIESAVFSQAAGLMAAVAIGWLLRDYRAMLAAIIAQSLVMTLYTHWRAERAYSAAFNENSVMRALVFGWPLVMNGVLIFLATQADRILVGGMLGVETLAIYVAAVMLASAPCLAALRISGALGLPLLSAAQSDRTEFNSRYTIFGATLGWLAIIVFIPMASLGHFAVPIVFGADYAVPRDLVIWIAIGLGVRLFRNWVVVGALAIGDTKTLLYVNLIRSFGVAIAYLAVSQGFGVLGVATALAFGEIVSLFFGVVRQNIRLGARAMASAKLMLITTAALASPLALSTIVPEQDAFSSVAAAVALTAVGLGAVLVTNEALREIVRTFLLRLFRLFLT